MTTTDDSLIDWAEETGGRLAALAELAKRATANNKAWFKLYRQIQAIADGDETEWERYTSIATNHLLDTLRAAFLARPTIVCLCGSTRFHQAYQDANLAETLAGNIVLTIGCDLRSDADLAAAGQLGLDPDTAKTRLDDLHLRKVELAHEILILNVAGYIGPSTQRELDHALHLGKTVRYLEPPQ